MHIFRGFRQIQAAVQLTHPSPLATPLDYEAVAQNRPLNKTCHQRPRVNLIGKYEQSLAEPR